MADFPVPVFDAPEVLTPFHPDSLGSLAATNATLMTASSGTWVSANLAWFYPFTLRTWATAYQLLFYVGATSSGNIDVGIYDSQQNLIVSAGSTAMSATTNTVQELNIADTVLSPGRYFLAGACDNTTGTVFRFANNDEVTTPLASFYAQSGLTAAALTNPGTASVTTSANLHIASIGIQFRSSPF